MSEDKVPTMPTSEEIYAAMTAEETPTPAPPASTPAPSASLASSPATETPAPKPDEVPPAPLSLTETSIVVDPADGKTKTWGEIKGERLRQSDYTKKTMALKEEKRAFMTRQAQIQAEYDAWKAKQTTAGLPPLPTDEPYAQHIAALAAQQEALAKQQMAREQALDNERVALASAKLEADVQRVSAELKLDEREMNFVGNELWRRLQGGEQATLDSVAKEFAEYREAREKAAVESWKTKHRVETPAPPAGTPSTGTAPATPEFGTDGFRENIRNLFFGGTPA